MPLLSPRIRHLVVQVSVMDESVAIVERITNDVLVIAKLESSSFQIVYAPFNVHRLFFSAVHQELNAAQSKGASVNVEIPPGVPHTLLGDANRLQQVITCILRTTYMLSLD
jgi:signal transduction histidine kinase